MKLPLNDKFSGEILSVILLLYYMCKYITRDTFIYYLYKQLHMWCY